MLRGSDRSYMYVTCTHDGDINESVARQPPKGATKLAPPLRAPKSPLCFGAFPHRIRSLLTRPRTRPHSSHRRCIDDTRRLLRAGQEARSRDGRSEVRRHARHLAALLVPDRPLDTDTFKDGLGFDGSSIRGWMGIHESDMLAVPDRRHGAARSVLRAGRPSASSRTSSTRSPARTSRAIRGTSRARPKRT